MALIQANFISKRLLRTVTFNAIIPLDKIDFGDSPQKADQPLKTLYLLHGAFGNYTDYLSGTRIQRWAEEHNLAVIMPSGENQFYLDKAHQDEYYGKFVAEELVDFTRKIFPLSKKREDTFIAGLSMGGYGALVNGFHYHQTFSQIGAFSPALLNTDIIHHPEKLQISGWSRGFYENVFGGIQSIANSEKDYCYLIDQLKANQAAIPNIYMAIGVDDFLVENVRTYHDFLLNRQVEHTYIEDLGGHDWDFWDRQLKLFLEWLPLEEKENYWNSGNVTS